MARLSPDAWDLLAEQAGYDPIEFATLLNTSPRQLQRRSQRSDGRTPRDHLNECRIRRVAALLLDGYLCKQAAPAVRLKQLSHLSRLFKQYFGVTPRQFIVRHADEIQARRLST
jgi:AraC family chitin signaling transcriptional activator